MFISPKKAYKYNKNMTKTKNNWKITLKEWSKIITLENKKTKEKKSVEFSDYIKAVMAFKAL